MGKTVALFSERGGKSTSQIKTKAITTHLLTLWACVHTGAHDLLTQMYTERRQYRTKNVPDKYMFLYMSQYHHAVLSFNDFRSCKNILWRSLFECLILSIFFSYMVLYQFSFARFGPYEMSSNSKQKLKFIFKVHQIKYESCVNNQMCKYFPKLVFFTLLTLLSLKLHMVWRIPIYTSIYLRWYICFMV
jgi:hypothetical protein